MGIEGYQKVIIGGLNCDMLGIEYLCRFMGTDFKSVAKRQDDYFSATC